jgi:hypothetical protein
VTRRWPQEVPSKAEQGSILTKPVVNQGIPEYPAVPGAIDDRNWTIYQSTTVETVF